MRTLVVVLTRSKWNVLTPSRDANPDTFHIEFRHLGCDYCARTMRGQVLVSHVHFPVSRPRRRRSLTSTMRLLHLRGRLERQIFMLDLSQWSRQLQDACRCSHISLSLPTSLPPPQTRWQATRRSPGREWLVSHPLAVLPSTTWQREGPCLMNGDTRAPRSDTIWPYVSPGRRSAQRVCRHSG